MSGQEGRVSELSVTFGTGEGLLRILSIAMLWPKIQFFNTFFNRRIMCSPRRINNRNKSLWYRVGHGTMPPADIEILNTLDTLTNDGQ